MHSYSRKTALTSVPRIRLIIVEDDPKNSNEQKSALGKILDEAQINHINNHDGAISKILSRRHHIISTDLHILRNASTGSVIDTAAGLGVLRHPSCSRLTRRMILTGSEGSSDRFRTLDYAGQKGLLYLIKGSSQRPSEYPPRCNAYGWAECIAHFAEIPIPHSEGFADALARNEELGPRLLPYFAAYWRDARDHLPPPLAREANTIHTALTNASKRNDNTLGSDAVLAANRFRQWCLVLARAQTAALARHERLAAGVPLNLMRPPPAGNDDAAFLELEKAFCAPGHWLDALRQPWPSWHDHQGGDSGQALGRASEQVRRLRNQVAHTLNPIDRVDLPTLRVALWGLMDAAAYWADYSWFVGLRWEGGRWQGDRAIGRPPAWYQPFDLPQVIGGLNPSSSGQSQSNRVHQLQWRRRPPPAGSPPTAVDDFEPHLIDAWPWLRRHRIDNQSEAQIVALWTPLVSRGREGTEWLARGFDGTPTRLIVPDSDFASTPNP
jgi:hypothetical protein